MGCIIIGNEFMNDFIKLLICLGVLCGAFWICQFVKRKRQERFDKKQKESLEDWVRKHR